MANEGGGASPSGSSVYLTFITAQLDEEWKRKASLEQRGLAVITTSGTIVTLLFALTAWIAQAKTFTIPDDARTWLTAGVGLFVGAALLALLTNVPLFYRGVDPRSLTVLVGGQPEASYQQAAERVAQQLIEYLKAAQTGNLVKSLCLIVAMVLELLAAGAVAAAMVLVLNQQTPSPLLF